MARKRHDAVPAASPAEAPVRIMNLHQAKGLEAPVVFLADPTGAFTHEPQIHIDRSGGPARGYLAILRPEQRLSSSASCLSGAVAGIRRGRGEVPESREESALVRRRYPCRQPAGHHAAGRGQPMEPVEPVERYLDGCEDLEVPKIAAPPKTVGGDCRRRENPSGCRMPSVNAGRRRLRDPTPWLPPRRSP